ncbi:MAG: ECF transporter S component [Aigarchaeota archaeon]|nr:ECF transporter S component [Aigarchaeota archaeon]MCX8193504.1 ECF transporter S component [Nitrososphaeria archaeon]MDW7986807.1 ECF transporter S component [Nitrososphaerota archaeon]
MSKVSETSITITKKIVGLASFSIVAGLLFAAVSHVVAPIMFMFGGHLGIASVYGLWFLGGTLPAYIMRERGTAFLGETIAAIIELLLVSPYSVLLYYYGPAQGIMSELVFWLRRYRSWGYGTMILAGMLPVLAAYPFDCLVSPFYPACRDPGYPITLHITIITTMLISGALFSGVLVKSVVDRLVKAGALRGWPIAETS